MKRLPPAGRHLLHVVAQVSGGAQAELREGCRRRAPGRRGFHRCPVCSGALLQLSQLDSAGRRGAVVDTESRLLWGGVAALRRHLLKIETREAERHD